MALLPGAWRGGVGTRRAECLCGVRLPADTRKWRRDTRNTQTETSLRAMNEEVCRTLNAAGPLDSEKETFFLLWLVKRPREEEDVRQPQLHFKDEGCFHFSMKY